MNTCSQRLTDAYAPLNEEIVLAADQVAHCLGIDETFLDERVSEL
jgi:hypothetical protein